MFEMYSYSQIVIAEVVKGRITHVMQWTNKWLVN